MYTKVVYKLGMLNDVKLLLEDDTTIQTLNARLEYTISLSIAILRTNSTILTIASSAPKFY